MKTIRSRTKFIAAFAVGLVVIFAACGGGTSATSEPTPTPTPQTNRPPTADFTFQPEGTARGDNNRTVITFTATASDPDGDPLTFEWRFSSGTPSTAAGQVATTTFPGRAPYTVTLTVSDGRGGTVTVRKTVPVTG